MSDERFKKDAMSKLYDRMLKMIDEQFSKVNSMKHNKLQEVANQMTLLYNLVIEMPDEVGYRDIKDDMIALQAKMTMLVRMKSRTQEPFIVDPLNLTKMSLKF